MILVLKSIEWVSDEVRPDFRGTSLVNKITFDSKSHESHFRFEKGRG